MKKFLKGQISFPGVQIIPREKLGKIIFFAYRFAAALAFISLVFMAFGTFSWLVKDKIKYGYGADFMFILDESGSMVNPFGQNTGQLDYSVRKIDAAKKAILHFVSQKRKIGQDRYGLIVFGNVPIRILPFTFNQDAFLKAVTVQESSLWGTDLNKPMIVALKEMLKSQTRSKIIIFVSDGGVFLEENKYNFSQFVRDWGIKFYWIGIDGLAAQNLMADFMSRVGPLGKHVEAYDLPGLESAFNEIFSSERSLIAYKKSVPICNFNFDYIILSLLSLLLILRAFFFEGGGNED